MAVEWRGGQGKWVSSKSAIGSSMTSGLSEMTNFDSLMKRLTSGTTSTFTYLRTSTVDGQAVAQYKDVSTDTSALVTTMDVPLNGAVLPIEEDGGSKGSLAFTWNQPTTVSPPAAADILELPAS